MISDSDRRYLAAAVELAQGGLYSATPNPRVGCLVVKGGTVVGRGFHQRTGGPHAELNALADAAGAAAGATVYVSLEPCAFAGRTPACTGALMEAGVGRVVVAMVDPHPQVSGEGIAALRRAGIDVDVHELPEAQTLNVGYTSRITRGRPWVRLKSALSLDGRTGMASGESQWITGPAARADVQYWRARSCAIVSGSGTLLADDARLSVRDAAYAVGDEVRQPLRVVADSALQLPATAAVLAEPGAVLVAHAGIAEPHLADVEHICLPTDAGGAAPKVDLAALLDELGRRGCNEVLVEAGAGLLGAFIAADLWDEMLLYVAPKLLGSQARPLAELPFAAMAEAVVGRITDCVAIGDDLRLHLGRADG